MTQWQDKCFAYGIQSLSEKTGYVWLVLNLIYCTFLFSHARDLPLSLSGFLCIHIYLHSVVKMNSLSLADLLSSQQDIEMYVWHLFLDSLVKS